MNKKLEQKHLDKLISSPFSIKGSDRYINLGKTYDGLEKILIAPNAWFSNDSINIPSLKDTIHLRYEFFSNGRYHLRKEEDLTISDLPNIIH